MKTIRAFRPVLAAVAAGVLGLGAAGVGPAASAAGAQTVSASLSKPVVVPSCSGGVCNVGVASGAVGYPVSWNASTLAATVQPGAVPAGDWMWFGGSGCPTSTADVYVWPTTGGATATTYGRYSPSGVENVCWVQSTGGGNVALVPTTSSCANTGSAEIAVDGLTVPDTATAGVWTVNVATNAAGTGIAQVLVSTDGGAVFTVLQPTAKGTYVFGGGITLTPTSVTLAPAGCKAGYQIYVY